MAAQLRLQLAPWQDICGDLVPTKSSVGAPTPLLARFKINKHLHILGLPQWKQIIINISQSACDWLIGTLGIDCMGS